MNLLFPEYFIKEIEKKRLLDNLKKNLGKKIYWKSKWAYRKVRLRDLPCGCPVQLRPSQLPAEDGSVDSWTDAEAEGVNATATHRDANVYC